MSHELDPADVGMVPTEVENGSPLYRIEGEFLVVRIPLTLELIGSLISRASGMVEVTRVAPQLEDGPAKDTTTFANGTCRLSESRSIFEVRGKSVTLSSQNFALLTALARNVDLPVSVQDLIQELYADELAADNGKHKSRRKILQNRVSKLRMALEEVQPGLSNVIQVRREQASGRIYGYLVAREIDELSAAVDQQR